MCAKPAKLAQRERLMESSLEVLRRTWMAHFQAVENTSQESGHGALDMPVKADIQIVVERPWPAAGRGSDTAGLG